jgi:signal transduction histidine kinase
MRISRPTSLRSRLVALIALIFAPVLVIVCIDGHRQFRHAEAELRDDTMRFAEFVASDVAQLLDNTKSLFRTIGLAYNGKPSLRASAWMETFLAGLLHQNPFLLNIRIADTNGAWRISVGSIAPEDNTLASAFLHRAMDSNELTIGRFQRQYLGDRDILQLAYCIHDAAGIPKCIVIGALDFAWLDRLLTDERISGQMSLFPQGMVLKVFSCDGTIMARYPEALNSKGQILAAAPILLAAVTSEHGSVEAQGIDGVMRTYSSSSVSGAKQAIFVSVGRAKDKAFARARHALLLNLDLIGGTVGMLLLIAWIGSSVFILRPLDSLVEAVKKLANGQLDARTRAIGGPKEIVSVARAFDTMAAALQAREQERHAHEALLIEYGTQLRSMTLKAVLAEERERRRIAVGLHDSIGQLLATCYLKLGRAIKAAGCPEDVQEAQALVDRAIEEAQSLTFELSSPTLYSLGLPAALARLCEDMNKQHPARFAFVNGGETATVPIDSRVLLFRTARELMHNAAKHAQAKHVTVALRVGPLQAVLEVKDDGIGFDPQKTARRITRAGGFGLFTIDERMRTVGGRMLIDSTFGHGSHITIEFPLDNDGTPSDLD